MRKIDFAKRNGLVFRQFSLKQTFFQTQLLLDKHVQKNNNMHTNTELFSQGETQRKVYIQTPRMFFKNLSYYNLWLLYWELCDWPTQSMEKEIILSFQHFQIENGFHSAFFMSIACKNTVCCN